MKRESLDLKSLEINASKKSRFSAPSKMTSEAISTSKEDEADYLSMNFEVPLSKLNCPTKPKMSVKQLMEDTIEVALDKAITRENKGFRLLEKFGFKEGDGLGKCGDGTIEPIRIKQKDDNRAGIGTEERIQKQNEEQMKFKAMSELNRKELMSTYVQQKSSQSQLKTIRKYILFAEKAVQDLDEKAQIFTHELWPPQDIEESDERCTPENDAESQRFTIERLHSCVSYLRQEYFYCLFCGCSFEDASDLSANCPGFTLEDH